VKDLSVADAALLLCHSATRWLSNLYELQKRYACGGMDVCVGTVASDPLPIPLMAGGSLWGISGLITGGKKKE